MRIVLPPIGRLLVLSFCGCTCVWAQEATANHNVILRRDPTTSSPALEHLVKDARLTLIEATPDSGFYHVKTEDDRVGWVFGRFVSISSVEGSSVFAAPVTPVVPSAPVTPAATETNAACDPKISTHVYHPKRLILKQECVEVTGIIVDATAKQSRKQADGTRHEADGDTHGWLKVDAGFEGLLNEGNKNDEDGNLVFEIICKFTIRPQDVDAKAACRGYNDQVQLPPVGSHVRIVGRFVQDTFHGQWNEIHPVTNIIVIHE